MDDYRRFFLIAEYMYPHLSALTFVHLSHISAFFRNSLRDFAETFVRMISLGQSDQLLFAANINNLLLCEYARAHGAIGTFGMLYSAQSRGNIKLQTLARKWIAEDTLKWRGNRLWDPEMFTWASDLDQIEDPLRNSDFWEENMISEYAKDFAINWR